MERIPEISHRRQRRREWMIKCRQSRSGQSLQRNRIHAVAADQGYDRSAGYSTGPGRGWLAEPDLPAASREIVTTAWRSSTAWPRSSTGSTASRHCVRAVGLVQRSDREVDVCLTGGFCDVIGRVLVEN